MDDFTIHSSFCVILTGDLKIARVFKGFDALVAFIVEAAYNPDEPEWFEFELEELRDEDNWAKDDYGPWHFSAEIGEGCRLTIYRLT